MTRNEIAFTPLALLALGLILLLQSALPAQAASADFYVSPSGNDAWTGALADPNAAKSDGPFVTIDRARRAVADLRKRQPDRATPVVVTIRGGVYAIPATLAFGPSDSGTEKSPTVYQAAPGEQPLVSGGRVLKGFRVENARWVLTLPAVREGKWNFVQLWVDGQRRFRPRLPKTGYYLIADALPATPKYAERGFDRFQYAGNDLNPAWANLSDVEVGAFHTWTMSRFRIQSIDPATHAVTFTGATRSKSSWSSLPRSRRYFVENVKEALSQPGQWYLDRPTGTLTYIPMPGEDPARSQVIAPAVETLLSIKGDLDNERYVSNLVFKGITFANSNWVTPPQGNSYPQAEINLRGAVTADGARNCTFDGCTIRNTGIYAIDLGAGSQHNSILNCTLTDLGAGGVKIGTTSTLNEEKQASHNTVKNCVIAHGGRLHPAAVGVWIGQSPYNVIDHNTIADFYYTGLSVGWTWGYARHDGNHNTLTWNRVYDIGQKVLSDMGGFYSLGNAEGSVLSHNLFHDIMAFDYGGWGIYFDEGTTHMLAEDNIVYNTKTGGFHQHYGRENTLHNNIFAFAKVDQLQRTRNEDHLSFTFERNIVYWHSGPLFGSSWKNDQFKLNHNLYWRTDGKPVLGWNNMPWSEWKAKGHDVDSIIADPRFVDLEHYDFRLKPGSPAEKIGFKPIDLSSAGSSLPMPPAPPHPAFPIPDDSLPRR